MFKNLKGKLFAVVPVASMALVSASAFAQTTGIDTTEIDAAIADAQTKGVAIASAVTVMLFLFAGAKYLRRAK